MNARLPITVFKYFENSRHKFAVIVRTDIGPLAHFRDARE